MKTGWLNIKLNSELCVATGESTMGLVDMEIAHENGLPIIPAKRIKGALREIGKELVDWGLIDERHLSILFGLAGQASGGILQVYDAQLYKVSDDGAPIEDYVEMYTQLRSQSKLHSQEVLAQFTEVHTHIAIENDGGIASTGSLRSMRVVNKGIEMRCKLEIADDEIADSSEIEEVLRMCVKGLRQLGLAGTRGYGEVGCELSSLGEQKITELERESPITENRFTSKEKVIASYRLELEQPVMIAGRDGLYHSCEDWIPGSALLGALAAMYIADHQLGDRAHEDESFARIFLRGGVQFGYALPLVHQKVLAPCPGVWQQEKNTSHAYDLSNGYTPDGVILRTIHDMVHLDQQEKASNLLRYHAKKQVRMHHARARNRGFGRALGAEVTTTEQETSNLNAEGAASGGQLYQYAALEAGRQFAGTLRGTSEDIAALLECIRKRGNRLRIGRSRTAEYGNVRFYEESQERDILCSTQKKRRGQRLALHLLTPMLLLDDAGRPDPNPCWFVKQLEEKLNCKVVALESQELKYTVLSGYNVKWRMPKPHRAALDAGSSLILHIDRSIDVEEVESSFWGWNIGEGNGQVRTIVLSDEPKKTQQAVVYKINNYSDSVCSRDGGDESLQHAFIAYLQQKVKESNQRREDQITGTKCAEEVKEEQLAKIGQTKIHQLRIWAGQEGDYERMKSNVDRLPNPTVKEACQKIIPACEKKSIAFIDAYLRKLEWRVRER